MNSPFWEKEFRPTPACATVAIRDGKAILRMDTGAVERVFCGPYSSAF